MIDFSKRSSVIGAKTGKHFLKILLTIIEHIKTMEIP